MGIRRVSISITRDSPAAPSAALVMELLSSGTGAMVFIHDPSWVCGTFQVTHCARRPLTTLTLSSYLLPSRAGQTRDVLEFFAVGKHLGAIFGKLESEFGVGSATHSRIAVFDLTATRPPLEKRAPPPPANSMQSLWRRLGVTCLDKKFAVSESMTVDEMHAFIDEGSHLTFDYLAMVVVAAMIAGVGLLQDSSVTVVASMLVSPLMGPILCAAFGIAVCRWDMVWRGVRNELYGVRSIHTRFLHTKLLELHESLALTSICHFMH